MTSTVYTSQGAEFSDDRCYRYKLWRRWSDGPMVAFCMLNPSDANEFELDPTLRRDEGFSLACGAGGFYVINLFAFVHSKPKVMFHALRAGVDIVGRHNDDAIVAVARRCDKIIVGWGNPGYDSYCRGAVASRVKRVRSLLDGIQLHALRILPNGMPEHPLYLPKTCTPIPWPKTGA